MLSGGTQRRASTPDQRNRNINLDKYSISRAGIEPTTSRVYTHTLCFCTMTGLDITWLYREIRIVEFSTYYKMFAWSKKLLYILYITYDYVDLHINVI